jgi:hypothetical protein
MGDSVPLKLNWQREICVKSREKERLSDKFITGC